MWRLESIIPGGKRSLHVAIRANGLTRVRKQETGSIVALLNLHVKILRLFVKIVEVLLINLDCSFDFGISEIRGTATSRHLMIIVRSLVSVTHFLVELLRVLVRSLSRSELNLGIVVRFLFLELADVISTFVKVVGVLYL